MSTAKPVRLTLRWQMGRGKGSNLYFLTGKPYFLKEMQNRLEGNRQAELPSQQRETGYAMFLGTLKRLQEVPII